MKILLSVVGIGLGHATRSEAIYRKLSEFATVKIMTWGPAYEYFKLKKIPASTIGGYDYKGSQYTFSATFNTLEGLKDPGKLRREYINFAKMVDTFKPDLIVSDSDPNAVFYAKRRDIPCFVLSNLITTVDNYERIPKEMRTKDLVLQNFMVKRIMDYFEKRTKKMFVPSFEAKVRYREKVRYTDLIIRKKLSEHPSDKELRNKLGIDKEFYFVNVGGSDIEKYLFQIFRKTLPNFKDKYFIVSSNYVTKKVIEEKNMKIFPFIPNALEYLKLSKGMISPAGHSSISEGICYNKPMLVVPLKNHVEQLINAALIKRDGFGEACFFKQKINSSLMKLTIENFFKKEDKIKKKLESFKFKGNGAEQIAKEILKG